MKRISRSLLSVFVSLVVLGGTAAMASAQGTQASPPAAAAGASAEVKAGTGVENKESVGTASEFTAGTKVWIWSKVLNAQGTTVTHVWKKDGAKNWQAKLKIGSKKWVTSSRRQLKAGSYTVEVVAADGTVLGSVDFTVK